LYLASLVIFAQALPEMGKYLFVEAACYEYNPIIKSSGGEK
jgi:hypothetical protein